MSGAIVFATGVVTLLMSAAVYVVLGIISIVQHLIGRQPWTDAMAVALLGFIAGFCLMAVGWYVSELETEQKLRGKDRDKR